LLHCIHTKLNDFTSVNDGTPLAQWRIAGRSIGGHSGHSWIMRPGRTGQARGVSMNEVEKLKAALAAAEKRAADAEARAAKPVRVTMTEAGYIQVTGIPGISWKGMSFLPVTWRKLPEELKSILAYCDANQAESDRRYAAYKAGQGVKAFG
jgi:hypothetical protein